MDLKKAKELLKGRISDLYKEIADYQDVLEILDDLDLEEDLEEEQKHV